MHAVAAACANIALVKYWGNRDDRRNLPATGSISVTVRDLVTRTAVTFHDQPHDQLVLDGEPGDPGALARVSRCLDEVRRRAGLTQGARVVSRNHFPTGAGLASSASGFAALAVAASRAAGLVLTPTELSTLARLGSGSAARSIFGGIVELLRGERTDGADAAAVPLADETWPLAVVVAITQEQPKAVSSAEGMRRTVATSPFYDAWVQGAPADLRALRDAVVGEDLEHLGEVAEHNCLKLHSLMLSTRPALVYWNRGTLAVIHAVAALRRTGTGAWFTIDAGPQVKVLCAPRDAQDVRAHLLDTGGVLRVLVTGPGPGAALTASFEGEQRP